ncbi:hypothetical protein BGZ60DRAFT_434040 [Tricladium varicosporioides]|nr:hypothetical protein BGZ60DRAFT_434040 [Hymenoscyphus varicosporioides]
MKGQLGPSKIPEESTQTDQILVMGLGQIAKVGERRLEPHENHLQQPKCKLRLLSYALAGQYMSALMKFYSLNNLEIDTDPYDLFENDYNPKHLGRSRKHKNIETAAYQKLDWNSRWHKKGTI